MPLTKVPPYGRNSLARHPSLCQHPRPTIASVGVVDSRWGPRSSKPLRGVDTALVGSTPIHSRFVFMQRSAFVYLLRCADGTLYTGWTYNVAQRLQAHQAGRGARYTRTRLPVTLLYQERLPSRRAAMKREMEIKQWNRARKLALTQKRKA